MLLLTGGEAVLYKDFKKLYLELRKMGLFISINTNGTMFTDEWFRFFDQYPPAQLNVTLYGGSNETYARLCRNPRGFDQVRSNIDKMLEHHFRVHLNVTLTKQNAEDMEAIYAFGRERGLTVHGNTYCFPPVRKEGVENPEQSRFTPREAAEARIRLNWYGMNDQNRFRQWANQIHTDMEHAERPGEDECGKIEGERVLCAAGRANFWITWDGRMLPCGMIPNMKVSMKDHEFDEAWAEIVRETKKITLTPECAVCPKKSLCLPCAAKIMSETGSYSGKSDYLCEYTDEYIRLLGEAVKYLENEQKNG